MEQPEGQLEKPRRTIETSLDEFRKVAIGDLNSPELAAWMKENDVAFDSGLIDIVDGDNKITFTTEKKDFGTTVDHPEDY